MNRKSLAVAAAMATTIAMPASAADLPVIHPLPAPPPQVEVFAGGWYLRGDIGMSNQASKNPVNPPLEARFPADEVEWLASNFASAPFVGAGVGYRFNSWLRADVTGEYRGRSHYRGLDRYRNGGGPWITNEYYADKREWVGLVNAYLDLGTWYGVTPFVGAGLGFAHVTLDNFRDVDVVNGGLAWAPSNSRTNLAWALYAGLGYDVTDRLSLELGYRYLHLGRAASGDVRTRNDGNQVVDSWQFRNLHSHDLKVGMRWNLHGPSAPIHTPISRAF